ncbi:hypothetical protein FRB90_004469 [Tulasnella sp. 427]|nr:hypothetical protein FRB90_004469 [Tulasnella sp. 427]
MVVSSSHSSLLIPGPTPFALINRIPFDIFQIIFTLCSDDRMGVTFQIQASHVCRIWREYTLAMPLLWNHLRVNHAVPRWDWLIAQLERSGQAPLDISINVISFRQSAIPHMRKLLRLLLPHLSRWRSLHLENLPHKVKRILWDAVRGKSAPLLVQIRMTTGSEWWRSSHRSCSWNARGILDGFKQLEDVRWSCMRTSFKSVPTFKNLRKLKIQSGTLTIPYIPFIHLVRQILLDSLALESLEIQHGPYKQPVDLDEVARLNLPLFTHQSLQKLIIDTNFGHTIFPLVRTALVRSLILPKLERLTDLYNLNELDLSCCNIIAKENSLPKLRVLRLTERELLWLPRFPAPKSFLPVAIRNLVSLRALTFSGVDFQSRRWLPILGDSCPHLRWLLFLSCIGYDIPSIQVIVKDRLDKDGVTALEILVIQTDGDAPTECKVSPEDAEWFSGVLDFNPEHDFWYNKLGVF